MFIWSNAIKMNSELRYASEPEISQIIYWGGEYFPPIVYYLDLWNVKIMTFLFGVKFETKTYWFNFVM